MVRTTTHDAALWTDVELQAKATSLLRIGVRRPVNRVTGQASTHAGVGDDARVNLLAGNCMILWLTHDVRDEISS